MAMTVDAAAEENKPLSARLAGARSHVVVPMLKDNELIGAIAIYRALIGAGAMQAHCFNPKPPYPGCPRREPRDCQEHQDSHVEA
jgi:hypothetical protein